MINIALDTSILHSEGLNSRNMRLLTRLALAGELAIFIPDLVAREFVSKYVADAQEKLDAAHSALTDLRRKLGRGESASDEIAELLSHTTRIRGRLAEMLKHDFESWVLAVSADVKLTHCAEVKVTHLGHDGSLCEAADVDSGASSGDTSDGPKGRECQSDREAVGLLAQYGAQVPSRRGRAAVRAT